MSSSGFSLSDAVSGGLPGMAKYVAGPMQKQGAEIEKKELEATDTLKADLTENQAKRDALMAKAKEPGGGLTPPQLQPPPQQAQTNPLQIWGSSAMWIAALGGLLTRRPLINSLNASAAVLNAYKQHDKEATDAAFDTWKVENENALKMSQFAIDSLKIQLEAVDTDDKTKLSNFNVTQKALNGLDAFQAKSVDEALRVTEAIQAHKDRMAEAGRRINGNKPVMDAKLDALNAVKVLQAARQTRDPQKIAAAAQGLKDANERLKAIEGKGASAAEAKAAENAPLYDAAEKEIDKAMQMVRETPSVVGVKGLAREGYEAALGNLGSNAKEPAHAFRAQLTAVKAAVRNLLVKSHYMSAGAQEQINDLVQGLGPMDTPESTRTSLAQIKDILNDQRGNVPDEPEGGSGAGDLSNMSDDEILDALGRK